MLGKEASRAQALYNFDMARRRAWRENVSARLTGRDTHLLPFEIIRKQLQQQNSLYRGIHQVDLNQIVGSVGRYHEFTRHFLPLSDALKERWIGVDALATTRGWPPIELFKIGDVYFVRDGNHRVSVARQLDNKLIEAHVWEYPVEVEISPADSLDDVLIRLEEHNFRNNTNIDELIPDNNLELTTPGRFNEILAQIADLRRKLSEIDGEELPYDQAVTAWYDMVYLPTVQIIHDHELLDAFPGRTETDLFVWISVHRYQLAAEYGHYENLDDLARMLADQYGAGNLSKITRQVKRLLGQDAPTPLATPDLADDAATTEPPAGANKAPKAEND